jgi:hypothetical protein
VTRTLEDLLLEWALNSPGEKEKALIEQKLREHIPVDERQISSGYWIAQQLKERVSVETSPRYVMDRAILLRAGAAVEPLWQALAANTVSLRACGIIIARARDDGAALTAEKVQATILAYLDGTLDRKRPSALPVPAEKKVKKVKVPSVEKEAPTARGLYAEFYAAVEKLFDQMLVDVPAFEALRLRAAGRADARTFTETWRATVSRAKATNPKKISSSIRLERLTSALAVLHVDYPLDGEFTPKIRAKIKTQFRSLARLYHPDHAGSNPNMAAEYRRVVEANSSVQDLLGPPPQR